MRNGKCLALSLVGIILRVGGDGNVAAAKAKLA
jgi:hypothetical protein